MISNDCEISGQNNFHSSLLGLSSLQNKHLQTSITNMSRTKELECFVEVGLKFGAVVVIDWNAEEVTIWDMWGLDTRCADVQNIRDIVNLK